MKCLPALCRRLACQAVSKLQLGLPNATYCRHCRSDQVAGQEASPLSWAGVQQVLLLHNLGASVASFCLP